MSRRLLLPALVAAVGLATCVQAPRYRYEPRPVAPPSRAGEPPPERGPVVAEPPGPAGCCYVIGRDVAGGPTPEWVRFGMGVVTEGGAGLCAHGSQHMDPDGDLDSAYELMRMQALGDIARYVVERSRVRSREVDQRLAEQCPPGAGSGACASLVPVRHELLRIIESEARVILQGIYPGEVWENCRCTVFRQYCIGSAALERAFMLPADVRDPTEFRRWLFPGTG